MSTRYPVTLPVIADDHWGCVVLARGDEEEDEHGDEVAPWVLLGVDAPDAPTAEVRVLAWIDFNSEDDLRGTLTTAVGESSPGRWGVRVQW